MCGCECWWQCCFASVVHGVCICSSCWSVCCEALLRLVCACEWDLHGMRMWGWLLDGDVVRLMVMIVDGDHLWGNYIILIGIFEISGMKKLLKIEWLPIRILSTARPHTQYHTFSMPIWYPVMTSHYWIPYWHTKCAVVSVGGSVVSQV